MKINLLIGGIVIAGTVALTGCEESLDSFSSGPTETCLPTLSGSQCNGNTVESCASSSGGGWYEVNGSRVCSFSTNTASCAQQVVDRYCSRPAAREDNDMITDLLITKSENLSLQNKVTDLMSLVNQDIKDDQQNATE